MAEVYLSGLCAAPGFAQGLVSVVGSHARTLTARPAGTPEQERAVLLLAVDEARAEIEALISRTAGTAADMLGFQAAMLGDDELIRTMLAAIASGSPAIAAWQAGMSQEAESYAGSGDTSFAARTADLDDIRNRVLDRLAPGSARPATAVDGVVVGLDLPLSRYLEIDWRHGRAIVLIEGSPASHVAILARARGLPMVVGVGGSAEAMIGLRALVDASAGEVILNPSEETCASFMSRMKMASAAELNLIRHAAKPAVTADGTPISIMLNLNHLSELDGLDPATCDGIGLVRSELLFRDTRGLPSEEDQYLAYSRIVNWARGMPVVIRTLDAGGDKPVAGLTHAGEGNPFLGMRGVRLSLQMPSMFREQLRALARAAADGNVRIMLPMVTVPEELDAASDLLDETIEELKREGVEARRPELGIMVEVPASAIAVDLFDRAAFFSIGSNDLTQFVMAAGRDLSSVYSLADPLNPAVLRLIEAVARYGRQTGRDVSLCGDAAAEDRCIGSLLKAGLRSLSVAPVAIGRIKRTIATIDLVKSSTVIRKVS